MSTTENQPFQKSDVRVVTLAAVTADVNLASAEIIECIGARAIMLQMTAADINNRQNDLTVYVSNDGETFEQYNMLLSNVTNTNGQNLTRVATLTQSANGSDVAWFTPETLGAITHIKLVSDITDTDSPAGTFTIKTSIYT